MSVSTKKTLYRVAGDALPDLPFQFTGQNLALFSSITLRMVRSDGSSVAISHTVDDAAAGQGHFAFSAGSFIAGAAEYQIERVRVSDSKLETFPDDRTLPMQVRKALV